MVRQSDVALINRPLASKSPTHNTINYIIFSPIVVPLKLKFSKRKFLLLQLPKVVCSYYQELNDLHVEALSVMANCLEDMDSMALIQQTGGLRKLLTFVESSTVPDIQKNAAKAIAKAAYDRMSHFIQFNHTFSSDSPNFDCYQQTVEYQFAINFWRTTKYLLLKAVNELKISQ